MQKEATIRSLLRVVNNMNVRKNLQLIKPENKSLFVVADRLADIPEALGLGK